MALRPGSALYWTKRHSWRLLYLKTVSSFTRTQSSRLHLPIWSNPGSSCVCVGPSVKACTNSWSARELSPSSGGAGCTPDLGCEHPPWMLFGARTPCRCCAASSALPWSSRSLQWQAKTGEDLRKQRENKSFKNDLRVTHSDTKESMHASTLLINGWKWWRFFITYHPTLTATDPPRTNVSQTRDSHYYSVISTTSFWPVIKQQEQIHLLCLIWLSAD